MSEKQHGASNGWRPVFELCNDVNRSDSSKVTHGKSQIYVPIQDASDVPVDAEQAVFKPHETPTMLATVNM
jgi:hypothetical protein